MIAFACLVLSIISFRDKK
ncbi:hypothetical protein KDJ21_018745 [Metabacillus litoralis]|nr:hypothetical protein KDJ21_018745 [Metabacillus litoralis]